MDREALHKEIDLIQARITRMANNSFLLKGWTVSLIAVVLALFGKDCDPAALGLVLLVPLVSFWYLDAFFVRTEKMYRTLYKWVIEKRQAGDMSHQYDLNPHRFSDQVPSMRDTMLSVTLKPFYGLLAVLTLGVIAGSGFSHLL